MEGRTYYHCWSQGYNLCPVVVIWFDR